MVCLIQSQSIKFNVVFYGLAQYYDRTMRQAQRILKVQELFTKQEFVNLEDLCEIFDASKSSIRRDLMALERKGVLRRVHGGAISFQTKDEVMDFSRLSGSSHDEKTKIGKMAASLVENGQTVIMGGGSTVVEVAKNLSDKSIQIVTNSVPVAQIFWDSKQVEVTLTGGYLYPRLGVQLGPICERMLNSVSADVVIMGIRGITAAGISDSNSLIVESIRAMIKAARKVVIVADHSKFGRDAMIHVAPLADIDQIVTDGGISPEFQQMLKENDVECVIAS
jgi:DeoR family fructose operon transcriptional repressor